MTSGNKTQSLIERGRFEMSEAAFDDTVKGISEQSILSFDLKTIVPEMFVKTDIVSRTLARLCCKACDDVLEQYRGAYTSPRGGLVRLYFYDIPAAMGKLKLDAIIDRLRESLQLAQQDSIGPAEIIKVDGYCADKDDAGRAGHNHAEIAKILKEGLKTNPRIEAVHFWVSQVMQDMLVERRKFPMTREMAEIIAQVEIQYFPFWDYGSQIMSGSLAVVRGHVPVQQYNTGEIARQDLAGLFAACLQIRSLQIKNANALVVVPLRLQTVTDKNVSEFILAFMKSLPLEIKRNLIIEIRGVPASAVSTGMIATVERLSHYVRAYSFDTGILSHVSFTRSFPKLYACGFDISEMSMNEEEKVRLVLKYAENQKKHDMKYYIKGVTSSMIFDAAIKAGYNFVSGSYIRPAQKICWPARKMTVAMIKNPDLLVSGSQAMAVTLGALDMGQVPCSLHG